MKNLRRLGPDRPAGEKEIGRPGLKKTGNSAAKETHKFLPMQISFMRPLENARRIVGKH